MQSITKLNEIENGIQSLKVLILRTLEFKEETKQVVSLKGMLKGIRIEEKDFDKAETSVFPTE